MCINEYEIELLPMGRTADHCLTTDEDAWVNGQEGWNIFLTEREHEDHGGGIIEILDLDFPVDLEDTARQVFTLLCSLVEMANDEKRPLT